MKILIGTVTYKGKDYCRKEFVKRVKEILTRHSTLLDMATIKFGNIKISKNNIEVTNIERFTDMLKGNSRERITTGYNIILDYFLEGDYDYLLTLESDIIPPPQIIDLLLRHNEKICSATYMIGFKRDRVPCIYTGKKFKRKIGDKYKSFLENFNAKELDGTLIHAKGGCGLGCCLIHRSVFDKVKRFRHEEAHCDTYFHKDAQKLGFKSMVDTGIICKHYGTAEDWQEAIHKGDF